jgi:hypothetical protein
MGESKYAERAGHCFVRFMLHMIAAVPQKNSTNKIGGL